MSPQTNNPVLLSSLHTHVAESCEERGKRVLQTMKWGLIPNWHKGEPSSFPTLLNNCRSDGMLEKASFRNAVKKNQRCVVVVDGFFEWQRGGGRKQPYFIQFADSSPTEEMMEISAEKEEDEGSQDIPGGEALCLKVKLSGRMLTMAGLFDVWSHGPGEEPLFTYTVITVDSHPSFTHIHHRMPAVLDGEEAIQTWLDPALPTHQVVSLLQPSNALRWHPVSTVVNNVKNKTPECIQAINPSMKVSSKQDTLLNWFSPPTKKHSPSLPRGEKTESQQSTLSTVTGREEEGGRVKEEVALKKEEEGGEEEGEEEGKALPSKKPKLEQVVSSSS